MKDNSQFRFDCCRYIDDILVLNTPQFMNYAEQIYGKALELQVTHSGNEADYLDLGIKIAQYKAQLSVYNKTDVFNFTVNRYGAPDSFVASYMHSNVIYGQLLRMACICTEKSAFENAVISMFKTLNSKKFSAAITLQAYYRFASRYANLLYKFGINNRIDAIQFIQKPIAYMDPVP